MLTVKAPGKLILSGEHAVVYGHPAIAMAVDRYIELEATTHSSKAIFFDLEDLQHQQQVSLSSLEQLYFKIKKNYVCFKENTLGVKSILESPSELAIFALSVLLKNYPNFFSNGIKVKIKSSIPVSSGMGSSAALIIAVLFAVGNYLQLNIPLETYYSMALEAENMQHGQSSGMDLLTSLHGGCIYRRREHLSHCILPLVPMFLINTGIPEATTGECVTHVAHHFKDSKIGDDFAAVTNELHDLFLRTSLSVPQICRHLTESAALRWNQAIKANHQLLNMIGVVPEKVASFIREIEKHKGAAKICGAGSIKGNAAGMVLVFLNDEPLLKKINLKYNYDILPIQMESRGVYVV